MLRFAVYGIDYGRKMTEVIYDQETDVVTTDDNEDYTGWFCVKTEPYICACGKFIAKFFTYCHIILVWPDVDDNHMLTMCTVAKEHGRDPKVIPFKNEYGKCISYYQAISNPNIRAHG
jgi:hypothetical protein